MNLRKFFGLSSGLAGTQRFSNASLIHHESVLEHIGQVCLCCYFICQELAADSDLTESVLKKAVIHDVEEVLTGDIPRPIKYASEETQRAFHILEQEAIKKVAASLQLCDPALVITHHHYAKIGKCGLIVEMADLLAVIYKIHHEVIERGNRSMMSRTTSCQNHLDLIVAKLAKENFDSFEVRQIKGILSQAQDILSEAASLTQDTSSIEESVLLANQGDMR